MLSALSVLDKIIDYTLDNNIKIAVIAGDVYKNATISSTIQHEFNKRIANAAKKGVKFVIIDGNHDVSTFDQYKSPLSQFEAMKVEGVFHTKFHEEFIYEENGERIKFVTIPTYHTKEEVEEITNKTKYEGFPIVYVMHGTIRGAMLNDWLIEDKETYIEPEVFDKEGVSAVVLGHLHKHQIMYKKPLVFYTGSTNRIDFTEEKQQKGFVVLDVDQKGNCSHEFIEVNTIKFTTLDSDVKNESDPTTFLIELMDKNKKRVKDSVLRIRVEVNKDTVIDEKSIYTHVFKLGAFHVLDLQKKLDNHREQRIAGLDEHVDEEKALELYYQNREDRDIYLKYGKELIQMAKGSGLL